MTLRISLPVVALAFLVAATLADEQATRRAEARTAVEAKLGGSSLHPATKMGAAKETLLKGTCSPPPRTAYWLSGHMKLTD